MNNVLDLSNFIGAIISSIPNKDLDKRQKIQLTNSLLLDEVLNLSKEEDEHYNLYELKPLLRAVVHVLKDRIVVINSSDMPLELKNDIIINYSNFISFLNEIIDNTK